MRWLCFDVDNKDQMNITTSVGQVMNDRVVQMFTKIDGL